MTEDLRAAFTQIASVSKQMMSRRLRSAMGYRGRLAPKREPDGRALGGSIASQILSGRVTTFPDGWDATHDGIELTVFHAGRKGQVPRPIIGHTEQDQIKLAKLLSEAIARQGKKWGIFR